MMQQACKQSVTTFNYNCTKQLLCYASTDLTSVREAPAVAIFPQQTAELVPVFV